MIWSLLGALAIGLSLGLLGSGGSILTVPVLIYLVGEPEKLAIAESLGIVGFIAIAGFLPYLKTKQVDFKSIIYFGIPGMIGTSGGAVLSKFVPSWVQLAVFGVVMIIAAYFMLKSPKTDGEHTPQSLFLIMLEGTLVGILTGFVGVGGGFLIVPALVLLGGLSMKLAVGTSLAIIAMKSFLGFYSYIKILPDTMQINWEIVAIFSVIGIVGSFAGKFLSDKISNDVLRKVFAIFLVVMGIWIVGQQVGNMF